MFCLSILGKPILCRILCRLVKLLISVLKNPDVHSCFLCNGAIMSIPFGLSVQKKGKKCSCNQGQYPHICLCLFNVRELWA